MSEEQAENTEQVENKPIEKEVVNKVANEKKSRAGLIFGIVNIVLLLALSGGGYYLLQQTQEKQLAQGNEINKDDMREIEASKQFNAFQSQLATMQSQIATVNEEMAGKDNHFTKTLADFSQLHTEKQNTTRKELSREITQVKRQLGKTRGDWLLADAEYLLSIANQRLHLIGDVKTTRIALEAADQRLRESGDTAAYKVREQITKEISSLNDVVMPDIVGIFSSIQLLKDKVNGLAVRLPYAGKPLTETKPINNQEQPQEAEDDLLDSVLQVMEGYVTVKHSEQPVTKILTEEEVGFIRQQLNVKLEMIKIALVQKNDAIFKASIIDAKQWLNNNFSKNRRTNSFNQQLNELEQVPLSAQFPDVSRSLTMLKDITKLRIETDKAEVETDPELSLDSNQNIELIEEDSSIQLNEQPSIDDTDKPLDDGLTSDAQSIATDEQPVIDKTVNTPDTLVPSEVTP